MRRPCRTLNRGRRPLRLQRRIISAIQHLLRLQYASIPRNFGKELRHILQRTAFRFGEVDEHPAEDEEADDGHHDEESGPGHGVGYGEEGGGHDGGGDTIHEGSERWRKGQAVSAQAQ